MQRIDRNITRKLQKEDSVVGKDYWCYRYIDDYFFFFNDTRASDLFRKVASEELEKYKLYINREKVHVDNRPFISTISELKIEASRYLSDLRARWKDLKASKAQKEINRLRALLKDSGAPVSSVTSFLLSSVEKTILRLDVTAPNYFDQLYVYTEIAFYLVRLDMRVTCVFKTSKIVLFILARLRTLPLWDQSKLTDKLILELRSALQASISQGDIVEALNLLIIAAEIKTVDVAGARLINELLQIARKGHNDEYSSENRLNYHVIVSVLYYIGSKSAYASLRTELANDAALLIRACNPLEYAESAQLLLDLVACPHFSDPEKLVFISAAMEHQNADSIIFEDARFFRRFVSAEEWYFNWNRSESLTIHLKKKEHLLAY